MNKNYLAFMLMLFPGLLMSETNVAEMATEIVVHRSPSCSCCGKWVEHLKQNGYQVQDNVTDDVQSVKNKSGVTPDIASCHTALVNGYVVEGHVPADDIKKLLQDKPPVTGLSVPGMPKGTPGMEMAGKKDAFEVISFDKKQQQKVFNRYSAE